MPSNPTPPASTVPQLTVTRPQNWRPSQGLLRALADLVADVGRKRVAAAPPPAPAAEQHRNENVDK